MNIKLFDHINFKEPLKQTNYDKDSLGSMKHVQYHEFLKKDKKTIKIRKIFHIPDSNVVYVYYDDIPQQKENEVDRFADLDLNGDDV
jgi:hypothetical protein